MSDQRPMSSADDQHLAAVLRRLIATGGWATRTTGWLQVDGDIAVSPDEDRALTAVFEAGRRL